MACIASADAARHAVHCRHAAVSYNHLHLVEFLLQRGADVNVCDADNDTPLHVCETVECFELLLRNGANLRAQNDEGYTVRHMALLCCCLQRCRLPRR